MKADLKGRRKDEDHLLRVFRSFDTRFDGAISFESFRAACRYLGIEQSQGRATVDDLARRAGSDDVGRVNYQRAIDLIEIKPQPGTEMRDQRVTSYVVPEAMQNATRRSSDRAPLCGPLGDVDNISTNPWGSAASELRGANEKALSGAMRAQLKPEAMRTQEERAALGAVTMLQSRLLGFDVDAKAAAVRLKAALRSADLDRDGCIGYRDFQHALNSKMGIQLSDREMMQVSQHFDAGGAGQIDYFQMVKSLERSGEAERARRAEAKRDAAFEAAALNKVRNHIRENAWQTEDTLKRLDSDGSGDLSARELCIGMREAHVGLTPEEETALSRWAGNGVPVHEFVERLNTPVRAHQSQLHGMAMFNDTTDPWEGRGKRIVYQSATGQDFQRQYDYINSGYLTPDQKANKVLMQKLVSAVTLHQQSDHQGDRSLHRKGGGKVMSTLKGQDPESTGEMDMHKFVQTLSSMGAPLERPDVERLSKQFRGTGDDKINYVEFFNVMRHEQSELKQRPHASSQIGFTKGQLSTLTKQIHREKGKRVFHEDTSHSTYAERSTLLDHHDSFGRSGEAVDLAENLHTTWIPRTQKELSQVRKISDILSASRDKLNVSFRGRDNSGSGVISNDDFLRAVKHDCGHLLRQEDIAWLADRVHDNATGEVRYDKVVDVMKAHCALPSSKVNYEDAGIKISQRGQSEDRIMLSSIGATSIERGIRTRTPKANPKMSRRLDPWGKPLALEPSERTYEQQMFETRGTLGGLHGGTIGIDPQIKAAMEQGVNLGGIHNNIGGGSGNFKARERELSSGKYQGRVLPWEKSGATSGGYRGFQGTSRPSRVLKPRSTPPRSPGTRAPSNSAHASPVFFDRQFRQNVRNSGGRDPLQK
jgi:Ca2+-binding EF-hand superfamily protein